jgi:hypothetical protein
LFDHDYRLALYHPSLNLHLLIRLQSAGPLSLLTHALDSVHHIALLREKSVTEVGGPLNVIGEAFHHIRKRRHRLNAWIPGLLRDGSDERLILQARVFLQPLLKLDDFQRISGSYQRLAEQRVGIERNRCDKGIKLVGRNLRSLLRRRVGWLLQRSVGWLLRRSIGRLGCRSSGWLLLMT